MYYKYYSIYIVYMLCSKYIVIYNINSSHAIAEAFLLTYLNGVTYGTADISRVNVQGQIT